MSKAKDKGSDYERWVAKKYVEYGIDASATRMPLSGADEYLKGDIRHAHLECIPYRFIDECKRQETISWSEWWRQAKSQAGNHSEPVLHFKKSHEDSLTLIRTDTYFGLLSTIVELDRLLKTSGISQNKTHQTYNKNYNQAISKLNYIKADLTSVINIIKKYDENNN